jgi:RecA-family ATPase
MSEPLGKLSPLENSPLRPVSRNGSRPSTSNNQAIPNSHSYKGSGIGNGVPQTQSQPDNQPQIAAGVLLKVWEQPEPDPRRFIIEGLIPAGSVTSLYGDGEQGKSYLALHLATLVCMGNSFAGRSVEKGNVIYLDGELQADEFIRRAHAIARGMGLTRPPEGLYYLQLSGPLTDAKVQKQVEAQVQKVKPVMIVLDSFTMSTYDSDPMDARPSIRVIKWLEKLGTVLAIDHIRKPEPGANLSQYTAFGSAFKRYAVRSQLQLLKAEGGGLTILHKKSNFAPKSAPIHLSMEFGAGCVKIAAIEDANDERLAGVTDNLPAIDQVYAELSRHNDGATPLFISLELGKSEKTIRNYLTALKSQGRAQTDGVRWTAEKGEPK